MDVYLVQHGLAKVKEEDPARPLSEKGAADVEKMAAWAKQQDRVTLGSILHSGKLRAEQTADILAKNLGAKHGPEAVPGLDPTDSPAVWEKKLGNYKDNVMLVGHLPHLAKLTGLMVCGNESASVVNFQNAGIVCLSKVGEPTWSLAWIFLPELIS